jgi:hypothetical protein
MAIVTATTPTASEICAPAIMRLRISRPVSSVPKGKLGDGGASTAV